MNDMALYPSVYLAGDRSGMTLADSLTYAHKQMKKNET